jgi:hypothetical protein
MARDKYHDLVKQALIMLGWTITDDPYILPTPNRDLEVDLGAERLIGAEKNNQKIAVEIKSFLGLSQVYDFYQALGQFSFYQLALEKQEPDRELYLAVPRDSYYTFFQEELTMEAIQRYNMKIIVYDTDQPKIVQWNE